MAPHLLQLLQVVIGHAGAAVELCTQPGLMMRTGIVGEGARLVVLGSGHIQGATKTVGDHRRLPDMIRVHVCTDHPFYGFAAQFIIEHLIPHFGGVRQVQPGIHHKPAVVVLEQIQVDVAQRARHRHGQPTHTGSQFLGGAGGGVFRKGVAQVFFHALSIPLTGLDCGR